jgi:hypothetical protein
MEAVGRPRRARGGPGAQLWRANKVGHQLTKSAKAVKGSRRLANRPASNKLVHWRRVLDSPAPPLSIDCGGDCWWRGGEIGAAIAQRPAVEGSVLECRVRGRLSGWQVNRIIDLALDRTPKVCS